MKATVYVKNIPIWKRSIKRASSIKISHSEYIMIALERMERWSVNKKIIIELKSR